MNLNEWLKYMGIGIWDRIYNGEMIVILFSSYFNLDMKGISIVNTD